MNVISRGGMPYWASPASRYDPGGVRRSLGSGRGVALTVAGVLLAAGVSLAADVPRVTAGDNC
jgi:hypothetical protein